MTSPGRPGSTASIIFGSIAAFVVGERLVEAIRPALLLDPDPGWAVARFLLWLGVLSGTAAAGVLAAAIVHAWARSRFAPAEPASLPFRRATLLLLGCAALGAGALFRFAALDTLPVPLWVDDLSLVEPTLALEGSWSDFAEPVRPAPYGVPHPYGSVGVLYLELFRFCLELAGVTVFGVRLPSAIAGTLSVATAMLVGRALLPRGGGVLAGLALAGMRWSLVMSRWSWVAVTIAPLLDLSAVAMLASRRRRQGAFLALLSGGVAGLAAHVYLAAWIGGAALLLLAAWPFATGREARSRAVRAVLFVVGFALAAAPLFLLGRERTASYFARASDHNVLREVDRAGSVFPLFGAVADAIASPWFLADPTPRHDLPGRPRLGWIAGPFALFAFAHAILRPRHELSAWLLATAAAACAATIAGGRADVPNGYRFAYLADVAAVAAAAGAMLLAAAVGASRRREVAVVLVGLIVVASAAGARDALLRWTTVRSTFDGFHGQDTLLARAALRWERYGTVDPDPTLAHSRITVGTIVRYGLDPDVGVAGRARRGASRSFRIVRPDSAPRAGERLVERVNDAWGREWARVYGRRGRRALGGVIASDTPTRAGG